MGVSERAIQTERDGWIVVAALSPEQIPPWAQEKLAALADPEFRRLYLAIDEALDWDPDDPRLAGLVSELLAYKDKADRGQQRDPADVALDPALVMLMTEQIAEASPMWQRLDELAAEQMRRERDR
ncbi:MAG: MerR family transcriptional regulator, partial [Streptosporangiaceae bacterium]